MARTDYGAILSTKIADTSQAIRDVNKTVGTIAPADWGTLIRAMKSGADYQNALDQMIEESATGSIASFTDGANQIPCKEVICHINPTETGTGEKSPSNPYVIGGFSEINVTQTGANQWNEVWESGSFNGYTGEPAGNANFSRSVDFIKVTPSSTLYFNVSGVNSTNNFFIWQYDKNKNYLNSYNTITNSGTFTVNNGCEYIKVSYRRAIETIGDYPVSINLPSTATAYEPYTGVNVNTPFGQTVYGGTLNVTTGMLTVDNVKMLLKDFPNRWIKLQSQTGTFFISRIHFPYAIDYNNRPNTKSNAYSYSISGKQPNYSIRISDALYVVDERWTNVTEWIDYIKNNDIYIVYPIATPITIQLIPTEIKTLLGANNIYHDCNGDTDVTYRANGELYVEQHS